MNAALARHVLDQLRAAGIREVCVCPGARNAPFIQALAEYDFKVYWHFEERAAAFFALGRIRATGRPMAVATTSGTAAGELLPAAMEAHYSGLPLVLLTADRPRRFRGTGAPQAAEQKGIFGVYAERAYDLEGEERLDLAPFDRPIQINVCFEDPNGAEPAASGEAGPFWEAVRAPLVVVGQLGAEERPAVERFLSKLGAPVYLEALSGLRESAALEPWKIHVGDRLLARAAKTGYPVDGVLRIGGVPTHRFWRDLEDRGAGLPVLSVSRLPFSGLGRPSSLACGDVACRLESFPLGETSDAAALLGEDRALQKDLIRLLQEEPTSEPGAFSALSRRIEAGATVFLGNSLPIREWDLAADWTPKDWSMHASRGLNGIDGQISTFLGLCEPDRPNWAILGDLTALYDLAAPWPLSQMATGISATLVVVNNGGGKIFDRMFRRPEFENRHGLSFEPWAKLWNLTYERVSRAEEISSAGAGLRVVELVPEAEATARFWARYEERLA